VSVLSFSENAKVKVQVSWGRGWVGKEGPQKGVKNNEFVSADTRTMTPFGTYEAQQETGGEERRKRGNFQK